MVHLPILIQTLAAATPPDTEASGPTVPITYFWQQIAALNWFEAIIAISFGTIYLFYGWRIFRIIVAISFGLIGLYIGLKIGEKVDDPLTMYLSDIFTLSANLAGIPGMSIPCGFSSEGLPVGLQIMGSHFNEAMILKTAYCFEQATEFHKKKPIIRQFQPAHRAIFYS